MLFVILCADKPDGLALRMATREQHLAYLKESGRVKLGGPFLDEAGNMTGSCIILEAENLAAAEDWAANDPYAKAGLFTSYEVKPWRMTVNPLNLSF